MKTCKLTFCGEYSTGWPETFVTHQNLNTGRNFQWINTKIVVYQIQSMEQMSINFQKRILKTVDFQGISYFDPKKNLIISLGALFGSLGSGYPSCTPFWLIVLAMAFFRQWDSLRGLFVQYLIEIWIKLNVKMACHYPE